jgi:hypothetical protein
VKQLTIRIAKRRLHLAEIRKSGGRVFIDKVRAFPLPVGYDSASYTAAPEALAVFAAESLKRARMTPCPAVVLFDTAIISHHEYYHPSMSARERYRRAEAEAGAFTSGSGSYITEREWYGMHEARRGVQAGCIYQVDDAFIRGFVKAMRLQKIKCVFVGSALSAYLDMVKYMLNALQTTESVIGKNLITVNIDDGEMKALLFRNANLIHMEEIAFAEGLNSDELLDFVVAELGKMTRQACDDEDTATPKPDYILISGERTGGDDFSGRLAGRLNIPCRSFGDFETMLERALVLGGELEGRKSLYAKVTATAGNPPKVSKTRNFLYGGMRKRRIKARTAVICGIVEVLILAAMLMMPAGNAYLEQKNAEGRLIIERSEYSEARAMLREERSLEALIQYHRVEEAYIKGASGHEYGAALGEVGALILESAFIEKLEIADGGRQLKLTVVTEDIERFIMDVNTAEGVDVNGTSVISDGDSKSRRCNVTVTLGEALYER